MKTTKTCTLTGEELENHYLVKTTDDHNVNIEAYNVACHALSKGLVSLVEVQAVYALYEQEKELINDTIVLLRKLKHKQSISDKTLVTMFTTYSDSLAQKLYSKTLECTSLEEHIEVLLLTKHYYEDKVGDTSSSMAEGNSSREMIRKQYLKHQRSSTDRKLHKEVYPYW